VQGDVVLRQVADGDADFGISTPPSAPRPDLSYEPLLLDDFVLICRRDDPLAGLSEVPWSVLATRPYIAGGAASSVRDMLDKVMYEGNFHTPARYECTNITVVGVMIAAGLGIAAQPRSGVCLIDMSELTAIPLVAPVLSRELGILTRTGRSLSAAAMTLLDAFRTGAEAPDPRAAPVFRRMPRPAA